MKPAQWSFLRQGMIGGLLGYLAIVLYYAAFNVVQGRSPLDTVGAVGQGLFGAAERVSAIGAIIAYNGVHLVFFIGLGIAAAWLLYEIELHPALWFTAMLALIGVFLITSTVVALVAAPLAGLSVVVTVLGNLLAAAAVGLYLASAHPGLIRKIEQLSDPEAEEAPVPLSP